LLSFRPLLLGIFFYHSLDELEDDLETVSVPFYWGSFFIRYF